jgi:hypothetical protein
MPRTCPCRDRGGGRHAVLRLFLRHADAPFPPVRRGVGRAGPSCLLRDEIELEPGGSFPSGRAWRRDGCGLGRGIPPREGGGCARASGSSFPASARPPRRCEWRWRAASGSSTSKASRSCEVLSQVASSMGKTAPITVRVNPDVDARTHEKIATGKSENKFGIPIAQRARGLRPRRRACRGSTSSASTCISAAS